MSLEILKTYENIEKSRKIAELYFLLGNGYLYEFKKDCLATSIE